MNREQRRHGAGPILMPGIPAGAVPVGPQQPQQVVMTPMNDLQLLCLVAAYQPVSLTPAEALERATAIVAGAVLVIESGRLNRACQQAKGMCNEKTSMGG